MNQLTANLERLNIVDCVQDSGHTTYILGLLVQVNRHTVNYDLLL